MGRDHLSDHRDCLADHHQGLLVGLGRMKIAVLKEGAGETRCAAIPETVKKFIALGAEVDVERGAGDGASIADSEFEAAGAKLGNHGDVLKGAGVVLCVNGPDAQELAGAAPGALLV